MFVASFVTRGEQQGEDFGGLQRSEIRTYTHLVAAQVNPYGYRCGFNQGLFAMMLPHHQ
jgi:hypothetical protein